MTRELRQLTVPEGVAGERIDSALTRVLGLSRTAIVKLLEDGDITTDNRAMQKSDRVAAGQLIEVLMPAPVNQDPIPLTPLEGLTVVYNDDDIVVIDKPVGCAAHPSPGWMGPTVVGALMAAGYTISTSGPAERAGVVHRLDAGTSGLMIIAKTEAAYLKLKEMFREHDVEKTYHALVQGHMDPSTGTIDAPIDRHPKEDHRFAVVATGKESITHYEVIEYYRSVSLVKVELETGRTHQIRAHLSIFGYPVVGDKIYIDLMIFQKYVVNGLDETMLERLKLRRLALHATNLAFNHPLTKQTVEYISAAPDFLAQIR